MKKKVTIKDIAREAGVSETTVSRYINGKYEYMSEDVKQRIGKVIKELDYRPSNIARSLKSNRSRMLGALIADIENPFSNLIIKGLVDKSNELGYSLLISISNNDKEKEVEGIKNFLDNGVEGLIVNTVIGNSDILERTNVDVPIVLIDREVKGLEFDLVTTNNYELGAELIKHIVDLGYEKIGFFTDEINNSVRKIRHKAFIDIVSANPNVYGKTFIIDKNEDQRNHSILSNFLDTSKKTAIVASNGLIQLAVLKELKKINSEVVGFAGFDDWDWSTLIGENGITSVHQNSYDLGYKAVDVLHKRLENNTSKDKVMKEIIRGNIKIRNSTTKGLSIYENTTSN